MKKRKLMSKIQLWINSHRKVFKTGWIFLWLFFLFIGWEVYGPLFSLTYNLDIFLGRLIAMWLVISMQFALEYIYKI